MNLLLQDGEAGEAVNEQRRLAMPRLREVVLRAFPRHGREWPLKDFIGLLEDFGGGRILDGEVFAHAHGLGALAGEEECDAFAHVEKEGRSEPGEAAPNWPFNL
jgi:hypothetical protein